MCELHPHTKQKVNTHTSAPRPRERAFAQGCGADGDTAVTPRERTERRFGRSGHRADREADPIREPRQDREVPAIGDVESRDKRGSNVIIQRRRSAQAQRARMPTPSIESTPRAHASTHTHTRMPMDLAVVHATATRQGHTRRAGVMYPPRRRWPTPQPYDFI